MFFKAPTEILEYQIDWDDWLGALTIASSSFTAPAGITIDEDSNTTTTTAVTLSGGTWGATYEISNTIVASDGQTETRSISIRIQRSVAYCTTGEVRRRASGGSGSGGSATESALPQAELEALVEQASRFFDTECGLPAGYFNPAPIPIATSQTFYGDGTNFLRLPPYVAGSLNTTITVPDDYTAPTFIARDGYLILSSSGVMTHRIAPFLSPWYAGWYSGVPITISAIWGWDETPQDVKMAVIELVLNLWRETDPAQQRLVNLDGMALRERMPPRVLEIAKRYRMTGVAFV